MLRNHTSLLPYLDPEEPLPRIVPLRLPIDFCQCISLSAVVECPTAVRYVTKLDVMTNRSKPFPHLGHRRVLKLDGTALNSRIFSGEQLHGRAAANMLPRSTRRVAR
jgi:hypothetical protein